MGYDNQDIVMELKELNKGIRRIGYLIEQLIRQRALEK
jgi:hypothetical protein